MSEYQTFDPGTIARCNRCDEKGRLPRAVNAIRENSACWRVVDMVTLTCGHLDSHWVFNADLGPELHDYVRAKSRQKWFTVVLFEKEPRESPRTSKEGMELAKFIGLGDAWVYAQAKCKAPEWSRAWALVIR